MQVATPVSPAERIQSVDVLRGFSLLGILLLNIMALGLPFAAYMNPTVHGGATGANLTAWLVAQTLFDGKMRAIFSMLFGTSAVIMLWRLEQRGAGIEAADIYYRRTMWLILIGLIHAHLIWYGDILYGYGVIGLLLFPLRKLSSRALVLAGAVILLLHSGMNLGGMFAMRELSDKAAAAAQAQAAGEKLTPAQAAAIQEWKPVQAMFQPPAEEVRKEIEAHRGGWLKNLSLRSGQAAVFEFQMFFQFLFLDVCGMLVLGMGLAKAGVFDASRSYRFYGLMMLLGFATGIPLDYWGATRWIASSFGVPEFFGYVNATHDAGRFAVAAGYVGLIMIICKSGALRWVTGPLAAVGRTALSNYLLTSILLTWFFNGYGLGYFGTIERAALYWVVAGMWVINLVASPLWLRYYRYGPAEWAWRSLTYWERQPLRREPVPVAAPVMEQFPNDRAAGTVSGLE